MATEPFPLQPSPAPEGGSPASGREPDFLEARGLRKVYPHAGEPVVALESVDFSLARGEYAAVVGCSGSGKTTLLNLLGGLERPTSGEVLLEGQPLSRLDEASLAALRLARVGFVFQDFCLVAGLSSFDNVRLPLYLSGRLEGSSERARRLIEEVGLEARASHLPRQLSRGEMQRVAVARALACDPDILLVDEPTGNLDAESSSAIQVLFERFCRRDGKTLVLATHDTTLSGNADRILRLSYGRLETSS